MFTLGPREFIVGLGSNSDNAVEMLRRARGALRAHPDFCLLASSPLYESDALLPPQAPEHWNRTYFNGACLLEYTAAPMSAAAMVAAFKEIERALGRVEAPRWAPRIIDLDLLAWGGPDVCDATATVPHAGLWERPFALLPAQDCAGPRRCDLTHPWRYADAEQVPLRTRLSTSAWPELVAVLNITPDSFSGGAPLQALVKDGATIIDVGAESTRPGATPISPAMEQQRLAPVLETLQGFRLSLDSRHSATVAWALERFPVDWINDVGGFSDPRLHEIAARSRCTVVLMHSMGVPPQRHVTLDIHRDPIAQLLDWGKTKIQELTQRGIPRHRIIFDPGIGFGKTTAQNLAIICRASEFSALQVPLLMGHSRKRFLDPTDAVPAAARDLETAILTAQMANSGVDYIRVHDIETQKRALQLGSRLI